MAIIHSSKNLEKRNGAAIRFLKNFTKTVRYCRSASRKAWIQFLGDSSKAPEWGKNFHRRPMPRAVIRVKNQYISWFAWIKPRFSTQNPPRSGKKKQDRGDVGDLKDGID